jgi:hypothetical protein
MIPLAMIVLDELSDYLPEVQLTDWAESWNPTGSHGTLGIGKASLPIVAARRSQW